jgi:hypothetical protein
MESSQPDQDYVERFGGARIITQRGKTAPGGEVFS